MENASKALLMAGGVLVAILIIGLLVYSFGTMGGYFDTENSKELAEQLKIFNDQYEVYNRKLLRGADVVSVINKVLDNNQKYGPSEYDEPEFLMQVELEIKETVGNLQEGNTYSLEDYITMRQNTGNFTDFKRKVFDCKEIRYHRETGRVNYICFMERIITE